MSISILVTILLAVILIVFATKVLVRIIGFLIALAAIVGLMYYFSWGPFKKNIASIKQLEKRYCEEERDDDICECIVSKVKLDMVERFSEAEREAIESNKAKSIYVLRKSMNKTKEESLRCLALRGQTEKYEEFMKDLIPLANEDLDFLKEKSGQVKDWLSSKTDSMKEDFKALDDNY